MKAIETDKAPKAIGPYSQGIVSGNLIFTAGQIPLTPAGEMVSGGIGEQAKQVFENLKAVLERQGSGLGKVVKVTVFLKDLGDFAKMNEVYAAYFNEHKPARSTVQVAALPKGALVEIDMVAEK